MSKDLFIQQITQIERDLKQIQLEIDQLPGKQIKRQSTKEKAQKLARTWFEEIEPILVRYKVPEEIIKKYHSFFDILLLHTISNPLKSSCISNITNILVDLGKDILPPVMRHTDKILSIQNLSKILENTTEEEQEYLIESLKCAERNYLRASCVMGWNATINRIQKVIEKLGFEEFNKKTEEMKNLKEGRFKRFNKSYSIHSLSELRTIFDNDLLWVLEYWGLIDNNQHERLSLCFTMRNNCAHPGEAPLTEENLASFYSDIKLIIFDNPKFKI
ncbi:MAG: hypothetical protein NTV61_04560 [Candidatus Bathyarchaeota archaeon]|nr:hypothetical protein [Candidatus Bathyarchaeota archaeon]